MTLSVQYTKSHQSLGFTKYVNDLLFPRSQQASAQHNKVNFISVQRETDRISGHTERRISVHTGLLCTQRYLIKSLGQTILWNSYYISQQRDIIKNTPKYFKETVAVLKPHSLCRVLFTTLILKSSTKHFNTKVT